jgi:hypothetical protein
VSSLVGSAPERIHPDLPYFSRLVPNFYRKKDTLPGLVDLRQNLVYLDQDVLPQKQAFLKLHEAGHKVLPWQRDSYLFLDDATTLDPDVRACFEREANYFAASVLFQLNRFDQDVADLPLSLRSALSLVKRYGASAHATIRRFVERNHRSCVLLVLNLPATLQPSGLSFTVKSIISSYQFRRYLNEFVCPTYVGNEYPFVGALLRGKKFSQGDGAVLINTRNDYMECSWQVFNSTFNAFVLLQPLRSYI